MPAREATARIKINRLLEAAGWRFFADGAQPANIRLEPGVTLKHTDLDAFGDDFETVNKGFVDFLLLDAKGFPLLILEAKAEDKNPLIGKEQARKYARSQNCRFVILSNGTCITSGIWNGATPTSSPRSRRPIPSPATRRSRPTPSVWSKKISATITSS